METIRSIRAAVSKDLFGACFHILLAPRHIHFLRYAWMGKESYSGVRYAGGGGGSDPR